MTASGVATRVVAILSGLCVLLVGCDATSHAEMDWAKAALQRNGDLEIVATDQQSGAFTVRVKRTGELRMVRASDLVAGLPAADTSSAATGEPAAPAPAAAEPAETAPPAEPEEGEPAVAQSSANEPASGSAAAPPVEDASAQKNVIKSGPGYSIRAADPSNVRAATPSVSSAGSTTAVEHRYEPIICQGARLLHIDNRNLEFEGDAVTAEAGCEIHITNSRIMARGMGISAKGANVHIKNSSIEGESGSVEASAGAQVYAQSSTFRGLQRRLDTSVFHDLGGNVWN